MEISVKTRVESVLKMKRPNYNMLSTRWCWNCSTVEDGWCKFYQHVICLCDIISLFTEEWANDVQQFSRLKQWTVQRAQRAISLLTHHFYINFSHRFKDGSMKIRKNRRRPQETNRTGVNGVLTPIGSSIQSSPASLTCSPSLSVAPSCFHSLSLSLFHPLSLIISHFRCLSLCW